MIELNVVSRREYKVRFNEEKISRERVLEYYSEAYRNVFDYNDLAEAEVEAYELDNCNILPQDLMKLEEVYSEVYVENEEDGWIDDDELSNELSNLIIIKEN